MKRTEGHPVSIDSGSDEDTLLLRAFLAGNDHAYTSIYNKYADALYGYGMGLGFEQETLKDAIQDVFYVLYTQKKQLSGVKNLKYYLFKMLKNRLLDIYKSAVNTKEINSSEMNFTLKTTILDELIEEEDFIILQNKINKLLETLTSRQKEAVYLRFIQELEYEEIGTLLDMTPQAARKLIFRAIKRMREEKVPLHIFLMLFY